MCAKEDFSGTHNFASNYADHMKNARKYWNALNEKKEFSSKIIIKQKQKAIFANEKCRLFPY